MADLIILAGGSKNLTESAIIPSATISIEHTMTNSISSYPVEKSSDGTFNAVNKNKMVSISGRFSDVFIPSSHVSGDATPDILDGLVSDTTSRPQAAFALLRDARDNLTYIDVVTGFDTYKDCIVKDYSVSEDASTGNSLKFSLILIQPRFTEVVNKVSANIVESLVDSAGNPTNGTTADKKKKEAGETCLLGPYGEAICKVASTSGRALTGSASGSIPQ